MKRDLLMRSADVLEKITGRRPRGLRTPMELPVQWVRDDAVYFGMDRFSGLRPYTPSRNVVDIFLDELRVAREEQGIFQLTMPPHIIGVRSRNWILQEIIDRAKEFGAWFAAHAQIVEYVKANSADRGRPQV